MKKSPDTFAKICEAICNSPSYANAARAVDIGESTLWRWIAESQSGNPEYVFEFMGEQVPLHVAMKSARKMAAAGIIQNLEHRALHGDYRQTFYKGQPQWQLDPKLLGWTDEELSALGMDRYQRDENGELVPVIEWTPPPVALALAVAAAHYPKLYGSHSEVTVNNRNSGVTTVKHVYGDKPKPLPAPVEVLAPPIAAGDDDLSDLLGEPSAESIEVSEIETPAAPMASPAPDQPAEYQRRSAGPMTDLERDLLSRLKQPTGAPRVGLVSVARVERDDLDPARTGPGTVRPGGMKIA
jgi:hypothetical protein